MYAHHTTAALAGQHRADLIAAAQHARECRRAKGIPGRTRRRRSPRLRLPHPIRLALIGRSSPATGAL
jgi:hypothetical protein